MQITQGIENRFDNREIEVARSIVKLLFKELQNAKDVEQRRDWAKATGSENQAENWDKIKASYSEEQRAFDGLPEDFSDETRSEPNEPNE